ncbi:sulfhydryl oxidase [Favolaschia claudopus]|uniref:Sulfhydryl oxidase n=1 Tax=Favolaschia claudopus TaxID=2862362 RepID=A0AAW0BGK4_9AGAR
MPLLSFVSQATSNPWRRSQIQIPAPSSSSPITPLPQTLTEQLSTEIYELILDYLDHTPTLLSCNLVCRSWAPRSKCLLLERMVCRPLPIVAHGGFGEVLCAVPDPTPDNNGIIFGTRDGIYRGTRDHSRPRLLACNDAAQIEAFPEEDFFVCLAGGTLMTMSLAALNSGTLRDSDITRVSHHVSAFTVHWNTTAGGSHRLCAFKTSSLSTTMKVFDVNTTNQLTNLVVYRELYIPTETRSMRFINSTRVIVALKKSGGAKGGFEVVDFNTAESQSLLDPNDPSHPEDEVKKSRSKTVNFFKSGDAEYLVCYDKFAFFVDRSGTMVRGDETMRWSQPANMFALREPYLLAVCNNFIEVWNIETGKRAHQIKGGYALLNTPKVGETILALSLSSGEITEILFHDHPAWDLQ